ncbi:MAG: hypothetical protein FD155_1792 [Bacteroidetes bacterium]|nr:MAG: hypothetical protein FD155_1792 [Bacteroidota bacterium]
MRLKPALDDTDTLILPLFVPDVGVMVTHGNDSMIFQVEFEVIFTVWLPSDAAKYKIPGEAVSKQEAPWFIVIGIDIPHATEIVIVPVRATPGFAKTDTFILPLFDPDVGETVTHGKDSETVQVEFDEILMG